MSAADEFVARMMAFAPGDPIICRGAYTPVEEIHTYEPHNHPEGCPIYAHLRAVELRTARGSRWYGEPATKEIS